VCFLPLHSPGCAAIRSEQPVRCADEGSQRWCNLSSCAQEAAELRPLLVRELTSAADLLLRDRARKAYALFAARMQPRLPFLGAMPTLPPPPAFVPGKGFMPIESFLDLLFPKLTDEEEIQLDTQLGLAAAILGTDPKDTFELSLDSVRAIVTNPSAQLRELQDVVMKLSGNAADLTVARPAALQVANNLLDRAAVRAAVPRDTLFPGLPEVLRTEQQLFDDAVTRRLSGQEWREVRARRGAVDEVEVEGDAPVRRPAGAATPQVTFAGSPERTTGAAEAVTVDRRSDEFGAGDFASQRGMEGADVAALKAGQPAVGGTDAAAKVAHRAQQPLLGGVGPSSSSGNGAASNGARSQQQNGAVPGRSTSRAGSSSSKAGDTVVSDGEHSDVERTGKKSIKMMELKLPGGASKRR
jgi:hypothetical protein